MKEQELSGKPITKPDPFADGWASEPTHGPRERNGREPDRADLPEGYEKWPDHLQEGWSNGKP